MPDQLLGARKPAHNVARASGLRITPILRRLRPITVDIDSDKPAVIESWISSMSPTDEGSIHVPLDVFYSAKSWPVANATCGIEKRHG